MTLAAVVLVGAVLFGAIVVVVIIVSLRAATSPHPGDPAAMVQQRPADAEPGIAQRHIPSDV